MIARRILVILLCIPAAMLHMLAVITEFRFIWRANNAMVDWLHRNWHRRGHGWPK